MRLIDERHELHGRHGRTARLHGLVGVVIGALLLAGALGGVPASVAAPPTDPGSSSSTDRRVPEIDYRFSPVRIDDGRIKVRLRDDRGRPLADRLVRFMSSPSPGAWDPPRYRGSDRTNAKGWAVWKIRKYRRALFVSAEFVTPRHRAYVPRCRSDRQGAWSTCGAG